MDEDVCETCGGDGELSQDTTDSRYEHTTKQVPCPDCSGLDEDGFEPDEYEEDDWY
jgi:DnaJ-class molecular chaperone